MRKIVRDSDPFSLDSLMDTLTCVVGVLIIAMAITQLVVLRTASAVSAIPRTAQELDQKEFEVEEVRAALDEVRERWGTLQAQFSRDQITAAALSERLEELQNGLPDTDDVLSRLEAARISRAEIEDELARWELSVQEAENENSRLQFTIDNPVLPTEIRLPERRTVDAELEPVRFMIKYGKIYEWSFDSLGEAFQAANSAVVESFTSSMSTSTRVSRLVNYFENNDVGDSLFRLRLRPIRSNGSLYGLYIITEPREESSAAEAPAQLADASSSVGRSIRELDPGNQYVRFSVFADSFAEYLEARAVMESMHTADSSARTNLAASWIAYAMDEEVLEFWDVLNKRPNSSSAERAGTIID